jgi:hypothetical protein
MRRSFRPDAAGTSASPAGRLVWLAAFVAAPVLLQAVLLGTAWRDGNLGIDLQQTLLPAADEVASGRSPYPAYGYPPLVAFGLVPLTVLPAPHVIFTLLLLGGVPVSLWLLGVRDWRCYGVAFLWAPVFSAVQTGNVTIPLLLGVSACWHWRDRARAAATAGGLAIAAKILCWPLVVWLCATRRIRTGAGAVAVAVGVTLGLWAILGFSGLLDYPSSLRGLGEQVTPDGYTLKALLTDLGAGSTVAGLAGALLAGATLVGVVLYGRRGDERRSLALAAVAMIVASPIVWLHSFALLLVPVALLRPRLSLVWALPVTLVLASGTGNGTVWQTALVLGVAALVVGIVMWPVRTAARAEAQGPDPVGSASTTALPVA